MLKHFPGCGLAGWSAGAGVIPGLSCSWLLAGVAVGKILPDTGTVAAQSRFQRCQTPWRLFVPDPSKWVALLMYPSVGLGASA